MLTMLHDEDELKVLFVFVVFFVIVVIDVRDHRDWRRRTHKEIDL